MPGLGLGIGVHEHVPFEQYAATKAINATAIKAGVKSMLHMHHVLTGPPRKDTPTLKWGRLMHAAILERDKFAEHVQVYAPVRNGHKWEEFRDASTHPDWIVKPREKEQLDIIDRSFQSNMPIRERLGGEGWFEVVIVWDDPVVGRSKARLDFVSAKWDAITDLKTANEIEHRRFISTQYGYKTHIQLAWYRRALQILHEHAFPVSVLAVESAPPFDMGIFEVPAWILDEAEKEAIGVCKRYRECQAAGVFPGMYAETAVYDLPEWAHKERDDGVDWGTA